MKIGRLIRCTCMAMFVLLGLAAFAQAETAPGKTSPAEIKQETRELLKSLKAYSVEQKEVAIQKTKAALDDLDGRIDALERRIDNDWDKMDHAGREKARADLRALRKQRTQVAEWFGRLKSSSGAAWEQMKQGFAAAYQDLHASWEKSEKEFGADQ